MNTDNPVCSRCKLPIRDDQRAVRVVDWELHDKCFLLCTEEENPLPAFHVRTGHISSPTP